MKKIILFGSGFIASNLLEHFNSNNGQAKCVSIFNEHKIISSIELKQYRMEDNIEEIFHIENPDYIVILHGDSFVPNNIDIEIAIKKNVIKITNFLEKIYKKKLHKNIKKIIIAGSASEYGRFYNIPIKEDTELHPTSMYGLSKIFLFNAFKYFYEKKMPIVYIRQFNTIGKGQREKFVLPAFVKQIVSIEKNIIEPILNVGDLSQERDFIDVRDTCRAYELLLEKGTAGETYNVASGEYISIHSLLTKIIELSNLNTDDVTINSNPNLFAEVDSLSNRLHADIDKIKSLGFKCNFLIDDTISDELSYWRKNV